jgi:hypothetical protein
LNGEKASECSAEEIALEVWAQLKRSLNTGGQELLRDSQLHHWFLDPDIEDADPSRPGLEVNTEPLLVNYVDTWRLRPEAVTRVPNLFLASDYVRTTTDLATMEAANEAARRAVNGVLGASASREEPCRLWKFQEPELLAPFRAYDRVRFRQGLPWDTSLNDGVYAVQGAMTRTQELLQLPVTGHSWDVRESVRDVASLTHGVLGTAGPVLTGVQPSTSSSNLPSLEAS